uniref:V-set and transmembrane domain containing 2 like n=1 Tax=Sinocyclocheilus grahami TaxID=75366 RepID=A0A672P3C8_SINGR
MGAFGVILRSLHCMGLYIQLSASLRQAGTVFTEVPHDITAQSGQDVEMACSFRGAGSPSYSLEIQWWYIRNHREWTDKQTWSTNQVQAGITHNARSSALLNDQRNRLHLLDQKTVEKNPTDAHEGGTRARTRDKRVNHPEHPSNRVSIKNTLETP